MATAPASVPEAESNSEDVLARDHHLSYMKLQVNGQSFDRRIGKR
jgi:hypothetical protein